MQSVKKGIRNLTENVINEGLCTGCGACIVGCPYVTCHEGQVVVLDNCTLNDGDCYKHCPRTATNVEALSNQIFGEPFGETEIGHFEDIFIARTTIRSFGEMSQDGGIVTTLLMLAIEEGLVDVVSCSKMDENCRPRGHLARSQEELISCTGSSYEASYSLEAYRSLPKDNNENIAVVGLGCQTEAVGKMRLEPPRNNADPQNIKLTIGLFCGWALLPRSFHPFLERICHDLSKVYKFDIPHTPFYSFDILMKNNWKTQSLSLDDIKPYINPACDYCWDMTAEFADISIGSAGTAFPGWNTVVVRTTAGAEIVKLAKEKKLIATHKLPKERFDNLKKAAYNRKKNAFRKLVEKTGNKNDLLYIEGLRPEYIDKLINC